MARITNEQLYTAILEGNKQSHEDMQALLAAIAGSVQPKAEAPKGSKKAPARSQTKAESPKDSWAKYQPKKDADGNYNWRSYKACRSRWLNDHGYSYEEAGWMDAKAYAKACKPFTDKFGTYVKKSDR